MSLSWKILNSENAFLCLVSINPQGAFTKKSQLKGFKSNCQSEQFHQIMLKIALKDLCLYVNYKKNYYCYTSYMCNDATKELSLCHKLWFYNSYIFGIQCYKSLIFQTYIIWSNRIHSLKYLRSTTLGYKDIGFRKAEFVAKTQFLWFSC